MPLLHYVDYIIFICYCLSFDTFLRCLLATLTFHVPDCGDDTGTS